MYLIFLYNIMSNLFKLYKIILFFIINMTLFMSCRQTISVEKYSIY